MAIQYKLKNTNTTNELGSILYIDDNTGDYSSSNPGGYGDPNIDRSEVALFLMGYYMNSKLTTKTTIKSNNPISVERFEVNIPVDGWYKFVMLSLPLYDELISNTYTDGSIYYKVDENKIYSVSLDEDSIVTLTEIELDSLVASQYEVATVEAFMIYNNSKIKIRLNSIISNLLTNNVDYSNKELTRYKDNYNAVRCVLQGAVYEFCRGNKSTAQKSIEFLNTNNYVSE